jgi:Na+-translocating ferredoxin:NAD+ oxidoreductase RnfD subunit
MTEHETDHVIHDTVHDTIVEHDNREPNWMVRIGLAVGGLLLLAGALAAWQMQDKFGGSLATALPWLVAGAILLGAAAVLESITTEIWVTLLAGVFLLGAAFIVTGRVTVQLDQPAHSVFVVDRFTGEVRVCNPVGCRDLPGFGGPSVALPSAQTVRDDLNPRKP